MKLIKGLILFVIFVIAVPLWLTFQIYITVDQTILNYDYTIEKIDESDLYEQAVSDMGYQFRLKIADIRNSIDSEYGQIIGDAMDRALTTDNIKKLVETELKRLIEGARDMALMGNNRDNWMYIDFSIIQMAMIEEVKKIEIPELADYASSLLEKQDMKFYFVENNLFEKHIQKTFITPQLYFLGPIFILGGLLLVTVLLGGIGRGLKWIGAQVIVSSILYLLVAVVTLAAAGSFGFIETLSTEFDEAGRVLISIIFEPMMPIGGMFFAGGIVAVVIGSIMKKIEKDETEENY